MTNVDYKPDSHGAEDYLALCKEIIEREYIEGLCMVTQYEKSWRRSAFTERNAKIRRLRSEGMTISFLCKRFGLSWEQVKKIVKEWKDG